MDLLMSRAILGLLVLVAVAAVLLAILIWARSARRPGNLGVSDGHLAPCPSTPNCVSTEGDDPAQLMDPIPYDTSGEEAQERLLRVIGSLPRTRIVGSEPGYLWVEFRTWALGFIDDVEFRFAGEERLIHFRSASRLGHSDLGVNRKRMERVREAFQATGRFDSTE
jgi:uncharacterized protein (DUF1499 family)